MKDSKNISAKITISRSRGGEGDGTVNFEIKDSTSGITFFQGRMNPVDFAEAITGLACQRIAAEVRGFDNLGKVKVTEARQVKAPKQMSSGSLEEWLEENMQEDGWILNSYLGSQQSNTYKDGERYLNYSVFKYVDGAKEGGSAS